MSEESPKEVFLEGWGIKKAISRSCCERRRYFQFYRQSGQFKIDYYKRKPEDSSKPKGTFNPKDEIKLKIDMSFRGKLSKWVVFTNLQGQQLKIEPEQVSNLNTFYGSERRELEEESLKKFYLNMKRTFTFSRDIELFIYRWKTTSQESVQDVISNMSVAQRSSRSLTTEEKQFIGSNSIIGKLRHHITIFDTGNTLDLNKDSFLFSYFKEASKYEIIKYKDLKDCDTFDPLFDDTILTQT